MQKLFGTDGVRGIAGTELTEELAYQIGAAFIVNLQLLPRSGEAPPQVVIGEDTRQSSPALAQALAAGMQSAGATVHMLGIVPTPAVAQLIPALGCQGGAMISASHNPHEYNGIKLFNAQGHKLPDELEREIEALVHIMPQPVGADANPPVVTASSNLYLNHLRSTVPKTLASDLDYPKLALDCANGSASATAPQLFGELGFACDILHAQPNGVNINHNCGSTHVAQLQAYVKAHDDIAAGFAYDGDADRLLAVDEHGNLVDGDKITAICARQMLHEGRLPHNTVAVTVMTNLGFHAYCDKHGITREITQVGDRYVLQRMHERGLHLGGEQSGHIIFREFASTGDGQLTALQLLNVMRATGKSLGELAAEVELYPQVLVNVQADATAKARLQTCPAIAAAITAAEAQLGKHGRVLVRASGTEPLVRIMLEGRDEGEITQLAQTIAQAIA
ncbi:MAG: phosphoglucosamine mutase [Oscillospiraceae bacterium]|nr:phosphoglucosamine mutase [Oscillospiraceae bacterium]